MAGKAKQLRLLKNVKSAYGGDLQKCRAGRRHGRPLSTRETMHLVLRSTKATGAWSFFRGRNNSVVRELVKKFAKKYFVQILSIAVVGNHVHLHIKLTSRFTYNPFIRALTGGIAMAVTGSSRWEKKLSAERVFAAKGESTTAKAEAKDESTRVKFWDHRPYTRIVQSFGAFKKMEDYVRMNELESFGFRRAEARQMVEVERKLRGRTT